MLSTGSVQAHPSCREDAQEMAMGEDDDIACVAAVEQGGSHRAEIQVGVEGPQQRIDPAGARGDRGFHEAPHPPAGGGRAGGPGPGAADIYQWLPFTQASLTSAAGVTTQFAADYGTFSYGQSTAAYLAPMRPLMTSELAQVIGRAFAAPGVAGARTSGKQVSAGTAVIASLRAFGPSSITFVVAVTQRLTDSKGHSQQVTRYAVTLIGTGASWPG